MNIIPTQVDPFNRDAAEALKSLRELNGELLVISLSEIPDSVERECDEARGSIINAIRLLSPLQKGAAVPAAELAVSDFKRLVRQKAESFALLFDFGRLAPAPEDVQ
jgi:hypothetical protein